MPQAVTAQPGRPAAAAIALVPRQALALALTVLAGVTLFAAAPWLGPLGKAAVVVCLAIGLWTTGWLPQWLTALVFFSLCMLAKVAPASDVFAGFLSSATWLVLSGAVIGLSIQHTGLGNRLASYLVPLIGRSFARAMLAIALFGLVMTFAMPSAVGRVLLLLPIAGALADQLGYPLGSKGRRGILLAGVFGTFLPGFAVLPANIPNTVFIGAVEAALGAPPNYGQYLLLHFPVLGLLKTALLLPLLIWLYRDAPTASTDAIPHPGTKLSFAEIHLAIVLLVAVGLWATDGWHGIAAAWIGLPVAVWCLFPGSGLMGKKPFSALQFEPIFYVAGIIGMGVVADHAGLGKCLADWALTVLPLAPDAPARTFGILSGLSAVIGLVVTLPGVPPVMTALVQPLAGATHWSPLAVVMTQVIGFSTVILPYQAPPLVVAIQSGGLSAGDVTRLCLIMAAVSIVVLWPLDYLWWEFSGLLG